MEGMQPGLTDLDLWSALVGIGMPPVVAVAVSSRWQPWQRGLVAVAVCVAAGLGTTWIAGQLSGVTPVRAVLVVAMATFGSYRKFWHTTGIAKKIEDATTPGRPKRRRKTRQSMPPWRPDDRAPSTRRGAPAQQPQVIAQLPDRPPWQSPPPGAEWLP